MYYNCLECGEKYEPKSNLYYCGRCFVKDDLSVDLLSDIYHILTID